MAAAAEHLRASVFFQHKEARAVSWCLPGTCLMDEKATCDPERLLRAQPGLRFTLSCLDGVTGLGGVRWLVKVPGAQPG